MQRGMKRSSGSKIYFKLIPFLILYIIICAALSEDILVFDEGSYMRFAQNLLEGFYSPPYPHYNLWSGPGYPIFIAPFVHFKLPLLAIKSLNAILLYFSLVISYQTFSFYASDRLSFIFTIILGFYFPIYEQIPFILTECLTWFLIVLTCYSFLKNFQEEGVSWKMILLASFSIAYLAMTKVIFGYVIVVMLFISLFTLLLRRTRNTAKKSILIFSFSFIFCIPWLFYTYHITNQPFYWGNSGSMSLYTMSSPYPDELGDWISAPNMSVSSNHKHFMDSISHFGSLEKDQAYKSAAIANIKGHPKKFLFNWANNVGRLLFSFPQSKAVQSITNYYTIVPNLLIAFLVIFSFIICILNHKTVPNEIILLFTFISIYLFGSSLVSAYRRMGYITIPFWFIFVLNTLHAYVSIKIKTGTRK